MSIEHHAPPQAPDSSSPFSTQAITLRRLLERAGLSQRAAARQFKVDERTLRYWCAGQMEPPAWVFRALSPRLTHRENLQRMIESNEKTIEALQDGRITGLGFGPGPADPRSVPAEIARLRNRNEEHRSLLRLEDAFERQQEAYFQLNRQWLPHGNGMPTEESISAVDAAAAEFRAAQADVERIRKEIAAGKR
jgi:hypothetical protein